MTSQKPTKRVIDAARPTDRDCIIWDSDLAGSKTLIAQYRAGGGRTGQTRRFTIGRYGTLTVEKPALKRAKCF